MNRKELLTNLIKDLEKERDALCDVKQDASSLRVRIPDENTPVNTVLSLKYKKEDNLTFFKEKYENKIYHSIDIFSELNGFDEIEDVEIDTIVDLKLRMFLNAPAEYKWGAIDKDGTGYVYINEPVININHDTYEDPYLGSHCVGNFAQYADEWDKIKIKRD